MFSQLSHPRQSAWKVPFGFICRQERFNQTSQLCRHVVRRPYGWWIIRRLQACNKSSYINSTV